MGAYCYLSIDNTVVWDEKNMILPGVDVLFVNKDQYEVSVPPGQVDDLGYDVEFGYRTSLRAARFRMVLAGYGLRALRRCWASWPSLRTADPECFRPDKVDTDFYERISFDDYLLLLGRVIAEPPGEGGCTQDEDYVLYCPSYHRLAFPSADPMFALSALVHAVDGSVLELDISEMHDTDAVFQVDGWQDGHLIIMTEGRSDNELLEAAFAFIEPDLAETIRFFNYDFRPQAGAGHNVNLLKSLAAAGIRSPIVALFDNDTAGHEAAANATAACLPGNFWVGTYPVLPLARDYPTLGPVGRQRLDINGSACSIELYLGSDCLQDEGGLIPVQWTGYNRKLGRYQGEIVNKHLPQERFREKLQICTGRTVEVGEMNLRGVMSILETVEHAAGLLDLRRF